MSEHDFVQLIASKNGGTPKEKTMGGKIWWKEIEYRGDFRLQQNLISNHYRILDQYDYRWHSSFDKALFVKIVVVKTKTI